jgi:hypothetical protein
MVEWKRPSDSNNLFVQNPTTSPFKNDNVTSGFLTNGLLNLTIARPNNVLSVTSKIGKMNATTQFMRVNNQSDSYGSDITYVITNGIVRGIVQTEPEWQNGGALGCPDFYAHIVITLPANATYFTYTSRASSS